MSSWGISKYLKSKAWELSFHPSLKGTTSSHEWRKVNSQTAQKCRAELRNVFYAAAEICPEYNYLCWNLNRRFQLLIFLSEKYNGSVLATSYGHEFLCNDSWTAFPSSVISNTHWFCSDQCGTTLPLELLKLFFWSVSLFSGILLSAHWSDPSWLRWWDLVKQVLLDKVFY